MTFPGRWMTAALAAMAAVTVAAARKTGTVAFTAGSYNVRIEVKSDGPENSWAKRLPRVVEVVRANGFDLVGFQEVVNDLWPSLSAAFPEYEFADGPSAVDGKRVGSMPIAYRPELFENLGQGRFALSERPDDFTCVSWGASNVRYCQWVRLRVRATGQMLAVFNQHPDWKSREARAKGMDVTLARVKATRAAGDLVVLMGDMNDMEVADSRESTGDYPVGTSIRKAKAVLRDSFDITETPHSGTVSTFQGFRTKWSSRLDYIFVSDGIRVLAHRTHNDRPGGMFPSDHDPISAKLLLPAVPQRPTPATEGVQAFSPSPDPFLPIEWTDGAGTAAESRKTAEQ